MKKTLLSVLLCLSAIFATHAQSSVEDIETDVPIERTLQSGDEHWFRVYAYQDGIFSFDLSPKTEGIYKEIYAELYGSDGELLFTSKEEMDEYRNYEISWITEVGKTYLVKVRGQDKKVTGNYELTLYHFDVQNIEVGKPHIKNLSNENHAHYFSFTITEAGYYKFECEPGGVFIMLENENFELIEGFDSYYYSSISLESGIYYFYVITKGGGDFDNTDYTISVEKTLELF